MDILSQKLMKILAELGFDNLTEIQKLSMPRIKNGESLVVGAPTGYGKTLAAFLPLIEKIDGTKDELQLLYVTPLRSLNRDIFKNIISICNKMGVELDIRHGDTSASERAKQASMPPHCLITTPETLQSMFLSKRLVEHMRNIKYVIVDEIQSLMESKRGTQFSVALERLRELAKFQIVGLSATIADFEATKRFVGCSESIEFTGDKKYNVKVIYPQIEPEDEGVASKENLSDLVANSLRYIKNEMLSARSTILFTNTRETAELLGSRLSKFLKRQNIDVHHSSLSKEVRMEIENRFKIGGIDLVIATSSLELGIDIGDIDLVIQYMSPRQVVKLIQRVGRSKHVASGVSEGRVLTINLDDYLESVAVDECRKENMIEVIPLPKLSLDILAHQIAGLLIDGVGKPAKMFEIIRRSYAYSDLDKKKFDDTLDFMLKHYLVRYYGEDLVRTRKGLLFYINNISSIPNIKTYVVVDSQLNKKIGVLDEKFVAENGREGSMFIMRGETWKIIKFEGQKISVVRAANSIGAIPAWEGELMPVHRFVAERAAALRHKYVDRFSVLREQQSGFVIPDGKTMLMERMEGFAIIHSPFGNKINEGIAKALSARISVIVGESVVSKVDPYRITIKTHLPLKELRKLFTSMEDPSALIKDVIRRTSLYEYRFLNVAKRFGVVNKFADFSKMHLRSLVDIYKGSILEEEVYNEIFSDKIDVAGVMDVIGKIKAGSIELVLNEGAPSPLAYEGFENSYGGSIVRPEDAKKMLRQLVLERLRSTRMFLQCLNCGNKVGEFDAQNACDLKCQKCGAKYIGFFKSKYSKEYSDIIKKSFKKKKLTADEERILEGLKQSGALYLAYGGKACVVGASYGIGPRVASRILSTYNKSEEELVDKIIEAEKNYIETRDFWN